MRWGLTRFGFGERRLLAQRSEPSVERSSETSPQIETRWGLLCDFARLASDFVHWTLHRATPWWVPPGLVPSLRSEGGSAHWDGSDELLRSSSGIAALLSSIHRDLLRIDYQEKKSHRCHSRFLHSDLVSDDWHRLVKMRQNASPASPDHD